MNAAVQRLQLPLSEADVRALRLGDSVLVSGEVTVSIGLPTHARMVQCLRAGQPLPVDLRGGAFFHLSTYVREAPGQPPQALYLNPSTSTRYNAFMPEIVAGTGLRLVGGKGGLDAASVLALREAGCAYLSFLGGGCTLLAAALRGVAASHWNEYISQFRLLTLSVADLGPATVAIDAHGRSAYAELHERAVARLPEIKRRLAQQRRESTA